MPKNLKFDLTEWDRERIAKIISRYRELYSRVVEEAGSNWRMVDGLLKLFQMVPHELKLTFFEAYDSDSDVDNGPEDLAASSVWLVLSGEVLTPIVVQDFIPAARRNVELLIDRIGNLDPGEDRKAFTSLMDSELYWCAFVGVRLGAVLARKPLRGTGILTAVTDGLDLSVCPGCIDRAIQRLNESGN